ncbi:MAG: VWA domain-containing protein [Planctomycetes bacterium]|nr:VWA domain-containing protein [Planctomycetota bacterium]
MPELQLGNPWFLLAALPGAALALWVLRRTRSPLPRVRRVAGGLGLALAGAVLVLAAAQPAWRQGSERRTVWVLLDRSLSVGAAAERELPRILRELSTSLAEDDYIGVIGFHDSASVLMAPTPARLVNSELSLPASQPADETWLAAALELASQRTVEGTAPFALLAGDGYDSAIRYGGDLQRDARQSGVRLFTLPVDSDPMPEAAIADCAARLVGEDQRVLALDLVVFSTVDQLVKPEIKLNGEAVPLDELVAGAPRLDTEGRLRVGVGRNPLRITLRPKAQLATYVVEISLAAERNTYARNDSLKLAVRGPGESRVLLLHGELGPDAALQRALDRIGLKVTTGGPELLPSERVELSRYQAVILSDVPATGFTPAQMTMLDRFVRDGGGLAMIGGERSFAPGGWFETAVEGVLPVTCDVTEKGRRQQAAMVVALDRSGSMQAEVGGFTKMELANEGCVRTINLIQPGTLFGMLSVDTEPHWIVPLQALKNRGDAINRARANESEGGGIYVDAAMREALNALRGVKASSKHVVLFSDGNDTERQEGVVEMVRAAAVADKITVSTICMGRGHDTPFLTALAQAGGGRAFLVEDATQLPAIFSREAALAGGSFIREEPFRPFHGVPGSLTQDVDFEDKGTPELLGYVAATARPEAHVWLWADEDKERPLLATWNVELGRALAFTSDARDRWSRNWLDWSRYDELWQRWVRWLLPQPDRVTGVESEWGIARGGPQLTLDFFQADGSPRVLENPVAEISLPDGTSHQAPVVPVGSGSYRIQFERTGAGIYAAQVRERPQGGEERLAAREMQVFVPLDELLKRDADLGALRAMARATGGELVPRAAKLAESAAEGNYELVSVWQPLIWAAVAGLFLALGARRMPSVWRARTEERRAKKAEETRVLSARAAFERVRQTLDERNRQPAQPARAPTAMWTQAAPPAPVPPPGPAPVAPAPRPAPAEPAGEGSLLSAMRKVRKQLDQRDEGRS